MEIKINQISSLDKVFSENTVPVTEVCRQKVLKNERFSYQLKITCDTSIFCTIDTNSPLAENITIYRESNACCDLPSYAERMPNLSDGNYLTHKPCLIPDILTPLKNNRIHLSEAPVLLWIRVDIPNDAIPGEYDISVTFHTEECRQTAVMKLEVLDETLPKTDLKCTQWFYSDCIASYYNTEIYSDKHWELIDSFIKTAADNGINMILSPVHNPPLDTAVGSERPNVQLVKISKSNNTYSFDFSAFEKWVSVCKKHGIEYYEIPHLFSQWGLAFAPNIYVDGIHEFGSHTSSQSPEYKEFLRQYLPALIGELKKLGIYENTYFHVSDEPNISHIETYKNCKNMLTEIAGDIKFIDALSDIEFYKKNLIKTPIPASDGIEPFLKENIGERWVYYCCGQGNAVSNRFIAMSSFRNRIMGIQMYKFGIHGFLQWGYNFYYSQISEYKINPYETTSADLCFPSGDAFSVYPGENGALPSVRLFVFYEALQDMSLCRLLEKKTSHDYVVKIIDELAGKDVRFADMPSDEQYLFKLRERIISELQ